MEARGFLWGEFREEVGSHNQKQDLRHRGTEAAEDWGRNNFKTEEPEKKKLRTSSRMIDLRKNKEI